MPTEELRYAQCWEDADVLLEALEPRPGDVLLSIASAGDNTLSLLTRDPARVIAVDRNPAQIAALELRVAAYRALAHGELLELVGSRPSARRPALYARCRPLLGEGARRFWDARPAAIAGGIGGAGRFERYLASFRRLVLPLVHDRRAVESLLRPRAAAARRRFHDLEWDGVRWRLLFRAFFSRPVLARLGRDPSAFRYVDGSVAAHLLGRARHALTALEPAENPYLHWILLGHHPDVLPHALREEHFETIRDRLDRLEWHVAPLEALIADGRLPEIDGANLSDIFEYVSPAEAAALLAGLCDAARPGARFLYWNMMVPRRGAEYLPHRLRPLAARTRELARRDKAFFYHDLVVEEVA